MTEPTSPHPAYESTLSAFRDYPLVHALLTRHLNFRRQPMRYATQPYLIELAATFTECEGADIMSAVQTGKSELMMALGLQQAGWEGRIVAMVFPADPIRNRFVHTRVDPLLASVPEYRERLPGGRPPDGYDAQGNPVQKKSRPTHAAASVKTKAFGRGHLFFLGSKTEDNFKEFSADCVIVDEYDQCDPDNIAKAQDRLKESPYPQFFRISNPDMPSTGIAALFEHTDQRHWNHRCTRCGESQPIDWFLNVVERDEAGRWRPRDRERENDPELGDIRPVCRRCHQPWERSALGGRWVAANPGAERRGYHLSRLDVLHDPIRGLFREFMQAQGDSRLLKRFFNSNLGLPWENDATSLSQEILDQASTGPELDDVGGEALEQLVVVAGIDVGAVFHFQVDVVEATDIMGRPVRRTIWACTLPTPEAVEAALAAYRVRVAVIDAGPELHTTAKLRDTMAIPGKNRKWCTRVWLCRFNPKPVVNDTRFGLRINDDADAVGVNRTDLLDAALDDLRSSDPKRHVLPEDISGVPGYSEQMRKLRRKLNEKGTAYEWAGNKPDHYRLVDSYAAVAAEMASRGGALFVVDTRPRNPDPDEELPDEDPPEPAGPETRYPGGRRPGLRGQKR